MISTASRAGQSARNTLPAVTSRRVPIGSYRPPSVVPRLPPAVGNGGGTMSATMQSIRQQAFGGQEVLIHGAGGGVGHLAVQIAKARGAHVTGTASAAKHDFVASLGTDELVDYRAADFAAHVHSVDVVLDT